MTDVTIPTKEEIFNKEANDVKTQSPESNPFKINSLIKSLLQAFAGRFNSIYQVFPTIQKQNFSATATGIYLERIGGRVGINKLPATQSSGFVSFEGILATVIPPSTECNDTAGNVYITQASGSVSQFTPAVDITALNGVVTVEFPSAHLLGNGFEIIISTAVETDLNGTFNCQVVDEDTVTYEISNTGLSTTENGRVCTYDLANIEVQSQDFGIDTNKLGGDVISLSTPIAGIDSDGTVQQSGLGGGADAETQEEYRARVQFREQNPINSFNNARIIIEIQNTFAYIRDVFVFNPEVPFNFVEAGQVKIFCTKKDNTSMSGGEITDIETFLKDELAEAHTYIGDIFVLNPTYIVVPFNFTSLTPDTANMKQAVEDNLLSLFETSEVGQDVTEVEYNRAISTAIDPATLAQVTDFTLSTPTGNISIADGEDAQLGAVTYVP